MTQTGLFTSSRAYTKNSAYTVSVVSLRVVREKTVFYLGTTSSLRSPSAVVNLLNHALSLADWDREVFIVVPVDVKNRPVGINICHIGSLSEAVCHLREIFKFAILSNAHGIFIAHNHPSGDPTLSQNDINLTKRVQEAGKLLGIPLIDHLIVAKDDYFSFKENNLL